MKHCFSSVLVLFAILYHADYTIQVNVLCPTEAAARKAEWKTLPLPEGKHVAFSSRWDDANPKHLRMCALLKSMAMAVLFT